MHTKQLHFDKTEVTKDQRYKPAISSSVIRRYGYNYAPGCAAGVCTVRLLNSKVQLNMLDMSVAVTLQWMIWRWRVVVI